MAATLDPSDFDGNMAAFLMALAEVHWDKAVVTLLNMEAIVEGGCGGGGGGGHATATAATAVDSATQQCREEILKASKDKIKALALAQLQKFIDGDSPAQAVVVWEKTKVLGFAEDASELYRNAFCRMVQTSAAGTMHRLQATRALAGVTRLRPTLSDSLQDSEESRKK